MERELPDPELHRKVGDMEPFLGKLVGKGAFQAPKKDRVGVQSNVAGVMEPSPGNLVGRCASQTPKTAGRGPVLLYWCHGTLPRALVDKRFFYVPETSGGGPVLCTGVMEPFLGSAPKTAGRGPVLVLVSWNPSSGMPRK